MSVRHKSLYIWFYYIFLLISSINIDCKVIIECVDADIGGDILDRIKASILCDSDIYVLDDICINRDVETIKDILDMHGYLDASIKYSIDEKKNIKFSLCLGQRYRIGFMGFGFRDTNKKFDMTVFQLYELVGIKHDSYFSNNVVLSAGDSILEYLKQHGYLFAKIYKINVAHDHKTKYVKITYIITLGHKIVVGDTNINVAGKRPGKRFLRFIKNRIQWKKNELYSIQSIEKTKNILLSTDIFKAIDIKLCKPNEDNMLYDDKQDSSVKNIYDIDVAIDLLPVNRLTMFAGGNFDDYLSLGGNIKRYNIDNSGGYIQLDCLMNKLFCRGGNNAKLDLSVYLRDLFGYRRDLDSHIIVDKIAHHDMSVISNINIIWQITDRVMLKCWSSLEFFNVNGGKNSYSVLGIPCVQLLFDSNKNNNRMFGFSSDITMCNYFFKDEQFINLIFNGKLYIPIINNSFYNKFAIEIHGGIGNIFGSKDVPREKRLFCGGATSLRGYGEKMAGELSEDDNKPVGSRFMYAFGAEFIANVNKSIDLLCFVDCGNAGFAKPFVGIGLGARVRTKLCNLKIAVSFPTKIRENNNGKRIDPVFQFRVNLENK